MILTCYISNIVMTVTIKDVSLKQPIQGMLKLTEHQTGKFFKSPKGITSAKKKDLPTVTTSGGKKDDTDSNSDSDSEENESSDTH